MAGNQETNSDAPRDLRLLAVIPARGSSKRIPNKNVRTFMGEPLIVHSIDAALSTGIFADVIVSTDSLAIQEIALSAGAEVPSIRAADLADDHTPVVAATLAMLRELAAEGRSYDYVAQLLPTSPLRTGADIEASFQFFSDDPFSPVVSVTALVGANPWWLLTLEGDGKMNRVLESEYSKRSQDQPEAFAPTGAVWWADCESLREHETFYQKRTRGWEVPWPRGIDIDSERDWALAEAVAGIGNA